VATIEENRQKVADYIRLHPEMPYHAIADKLGTTTATISAIARNARPEIKRKPRVVANLDLSKLDEVNNG
jgi:transcriptional regulator